MDYTELTVVELRGALKNVGLSTRGNKAKLVARLEGVTKVDQPVVIDGEVTVEAVEAVEDAPEAAKRGLEDAGAEVEDAGAEGVEEVKKTEVDAMPSETPTEADILADARSHYVGIGHVSGEWIFDDIPGTIAAETLEEALEKYRTTPGIYKVPGSHQR